MGEERSRILGLVAEGNLKPDNIEEPIEAAPRMEVHVDSKSGDNVRVCRA